MTGEVKPADVQNSSQQLPVTPSVKADEQKEIEKERLDVKQYTVKEAAKILFMSISTLRRHMAAGHIKATKYAKDYVFEEIELKRAKHAMKTKGTLGQLIITPKVPPGEQTVIRNPESKLPEPKQKPRESEDEEEGLFQSWFRKEES